MNKSMIFKLYMGGHGIDTYDIISKVLRDFCLDATIYTADGMWRNELEVSTVIELVFLRPNDPFSITARVHTFAGVLKSQLRTGEILITRSDLEDAQVI